MKRQYNNNNSSSMYHRPAESKARTGCFGETVGDTSAKHRRRVDWVENPIEASQTGQKGNCSAGVFLPS